MHFCIRRSCSIFGRIIASSRFFYRSADKIIGVLVCCPVCIWSPCTFPSCSFLCVSRCLQWQFRYCSRFCQYPTNLFSSSCPLSHPYSIAVYHYWTGSASWHDDSKHSENISKVWSQILSHPNHTFCFKFRSFSSHLLCLETCPRFVELILAHVFLYRTGNHHRLTAHLLILFHFLCFLHLPLVLFHFRTSFHVLSKFRMSELWGISNCWIFTKLKLYDFGGFVGFLLPRCLLI